MKQRWGNTSTTRAFAAGLILPVAAAFSVQAGAVQPQRPTHPEIEKRLRQLEEEARMLRQELQDVKTEEPAQQNQMQQLDQRVSSVESHTKDEIHKKQDHHDNMLFFRGGYTELEADRAFNSFTDVHHLLDGILGGPTENHQDSGSYIGAGFDFVLTHDVWGLLRNTWVIGELGLEYKDFGVENTNTVVPLAECLLAGGAGPTCLANTKGDIDITMLTISAAPKIKFMEGSKLRPWVIPVGLDIHVISPPSDAATVLDLGVQFGAGVDYQIANGIFVGIDGRYHYAADKTDSNANLTAAQVTALNGAGLTIDTDQSNNFWTIGGYIGIGF
jgi:opacity protein-like surface antigen